MSAIDDLRSFVIFSIWNQNFWHKSACQYSECKETRYMHHWQSNCNIQKRRLRIKQTPVRVFTHPTWHRNILQRDEHAWRTAIKITRCHGSSRAFIRSEITREGRWFIVVGDTSTDTAQTDDVSRDWRWFKYLRAVGKAGTHPRRSAPVSFPGEILFFRGGLRCQSTAVREPSCSFRGILSPGQAAPNAASWRWIIERPRAAREPEKFRGLR